MLASVHHSLSHLNGCDNPWIRSAAANIALHGAPDFGLAGMWSLLQKSRTRHNHAGSAVATLHGIGLDKSFLHRMQAPVLRQAFNRRNGFSGHVDGASNTRADGRSIDQHGAGAALSFAASVFAAGEPQIVAQNPQQRAGGMNLEAVMFLIDDEFHALILRPPEVRQADRIGPQMNADKRRFL